MPYNLVQRSSAVRAGRAARQWTDTSVTWIVSRWNVICGLHRSSHELETYFFLTESGTANAMYQEGTQRVMELSVEICDE